MYKDNIYDRDAVYGYAKAWAYGRNPKYLDFAMYGGDCTSFASQCIYAGAGVMNYTQLYGWYYIDGHNKAPAWSGVPYLYNFLIDNKSAGPYGEAAEPAALEVGDIVQLGNAEGKFYHTPVVVGKRNGEPLLAAHTSDVFDYPLSSYRYALVRGVHILGVRKYV